LLLFSKYLQISAPISPSEPVTIIFFISTLI
jgi:hypothetical protein